ncbi:MAG TPA: hypothetical protein PLG31_14450 [Spirochaetota bacterium]|nr:hypothetical protein [Spirochaetota bacterium]
MSATAIILHSLLALAAFELIVMTHIRTRRLAAVFATSTLAASIPLLIEIAALYGIVPAHVLTTARPALHAPFILSFGWLLNTYFLRHSAISMRALAAGSLALVVLSLFPAPSRSKRFPCRSLPCTLRPCSMATSRPNRTRRQPATAWSSSACYSPRRARCARTW